MLHYTIIKNIQQYNTYCDRLEYLTENYSPQVQDEVDLLSLLIQKYNDERMETYLLSLDPVELLQDQLKENSISQKELATRIGVSPQLVNDIIKYRREITKQIALKLEAEFRLKFFAFLKPYDLNKAT